MTKQSYEKPNMEIVMLEDVIKTSGGNGNVTCILVGFCNPDEQPVGCNPDTICGSDHSCFADAISCITDGNLGNQTGKR